MDFWISGCSLSTMDFCNSLLSFEYDEILVFLLFAEYDGIV